MQRREIMFLARNLNIHSAFLDLPFLFQVSLLWRTTRIKFLFLQAMHLLASIHPCVSQLLLSLSMNYPLPDRTATRQESVFFFGKYTRQELFRSNCQSEMPACSFDCLLVCLCGSVLDFWRPVEA
jgi:hypothetical protein